AHLGVDALGDLLNEQALADGLDVGQRPADQRRGRLVDELFELQPSELVVETGRHHADQLTDTHVATAESFPGENDGGEARDEGAVQIEDRADLPPGRTRHYFRDRSGQPHLPGIPVVTHQNDTDPPLEETVAGAWVVSANDTGTTRGFGSPASART